MNEKMYFVKHLYTYAPKNAACKELNEFVKRFNDTLIVDDQALSALVAEIGSTVSQTNMRHPKLKPIRFVYRQHPDFIHIAGAMDTAHGPEDVFSLSVRKIPALYLSTGTLVPIAKEGGQP
ncbi:MAG: hypothetical protein LBN29_11360 [Mediterranea sp.]|jgi:hypothetical protein|nr:hypothetical protein [Mediterranea sp.]